MFPSFVQSLRPLLVALALGASSPLPASAADPMNSPGQHSGLFELPLNKEVRLAYLLFLPIGYDPAADRRWPLLVFLHGAGERGSDLQKVAVHGPPKLARNRTDSPFILVAPQCPDGQSWDAEALDALLTHLLDRLKADPRRVYLTGLSMGGYGTWNWAIARPDRFAAIAPICGGGQTIDLLLAQGPRRQRLAQLPIWAFHGAKDNVVPLEESQRMIETFRRLGAQPKLTVYPDAGHDSWTESYDNPALYEWFLQQRLP